MATLTRLAGGADTTGTGPYSLGSVTPTLGRQVIVHTSMSGHTTYGQNTLTDPATVANGKLTFTKFSALTRYSSNANSIATFISNTPVMVASVARQFSLNVGSDAATGFAYTIYEVDLPRFGGPACRGYGHHNNQASGTPSTSLQNTALTDNCCTFCVGNITNPAGITPPTSFTEDDDTGYATPTNGWACYSRNSGHTSSSITAGAASPSAFGAQGFEWDNSAANIWVAGQGDMPSTTGAANGTGTTSCTPPVPVQAAAIGDLPICGLWIKPDTATAPSAPAGWVGPITNANVAGGGGTTGADTGPTRLALYYYDPDGDLSGVGGASFTAPTFTPGSSPNCCFAFMITLRSIYGEHTVWNLNAVNGTDSTTGTPFTATMGADVGVVNGDIVTVWGSIPTDVNSGINNGWQTASITGTGMETFSEFQQVPTIWAPWTDQGNDLAGGVWLWQRDNDASAGAQTFSSDVGGTTTNVRGPIIMLRVRASLSPKVYALLTPELTARSL